MAGEGEPEVVLGAGAADDKTVALGDAGAKPDAAKPDGTPAAETKPAETKPVGAPDKYEEFKLPEGVKLDAASLEKALPVFKEMGFTQAQAQKIVEMKVEADRASAEGQVKAWNDQVEKWLSEAKGDKEVGGEKFVENVSVANKAVKAFGTPAFNEMLAITGVGNHPEMIRFMHKIGRLVSDDKINFGTGVSTQTTTREERMFPNQGRG